METITAQMLITVVDMIGELVLDLSSSTAVQKAVNAIEVWMPIVANAAPALMSQLEDAVSILTGSSVLTADQVTTLQNARTALEAQRAALNAGGAP